MKNLADDIISLINLLRPVNSPIERDLVFTSPEYNHEMQMKGDGEDYFRKMIQGYVSYLKGGDPFIFAKRIDKGVIPKSLIFTKIIPCKMLPFQMKTYVEALKTVSDSLEQKVRISS